MKSFPISVLGHQLDVVPVGKGKFKIFFSEIALGIIQKEHRKVSSWISPTNLKPYLVMTIGGILDQLPNIIDLLP